MPRCLLREQLGARSRPSARPSLCSGASSESRRAWRSVVLTHRRRRLPASSASSAVSCPSAATLPPVGAGGVARRYGAVEAERPEPREGLAPGIHLMMSPCSSASCMSVLIRLITCTCPFTTDRKTHLPLPLRLDLRPGSDASAVGTGCCLEAFLRCDQPLVLAANLLNRTESRVW